MTNGIHRDLPDVTSLPLFARQPQPSDILPIRLTDTATADHDDAHRGGHQRETGTVDWSLVAALRAQASDRLSQSIAGERARLDRISQEELGRSIVLDLVESAMAEAVNEGTPAWSAPTQTALARAVFNSLFRLGRLQPLVDDDRIENIIIAGTTTCGWSSSTAPSSPDHQWPTPTRS